MAAASGPAGEQRAGARRAIPRTDVALADPRLVDAQSRLGRALVRDVVTAAADRARAGLLAPEQVIDAAVEALPPAAASLRAVVNATGVLVHTNLGRAPLSGAARTALLLAAGSTDVELDLTTGRRSRRGEGALAALRHEVPAAEAVHVVNNNAAALLLCALALAAGREIVVSRGELVEIGDGFRIPDLLTHAGARLREVGTTNRTALADYAAAVGPDTAFVLKVHPSNFVVRGFTADVAVGDLSSLGVPVVVDVGSGLLTRHRLLPDEPDVTSTLEAGADLVTASGDKLLGGPQAGLLFGRADLVEHLRRHPAARALRVDKLTLAALEATLRGPEPPVRAALEADLADLERRALAVARAAVAAGLDARVVGSSAAVGGGGAPGVVLPSVAVSLPAEAAAPLRLGRPAVVGRLDRGRCLVDLRTVLAEQDEDLTRAVVALAGARSDR
ncbi:MAG TPA: L-seryl-tRNA(Sec) selenium transferase [Mycobacteriales bacterium]